MPCLIKYSEGFVYLKVDESVGQCFSVRNFAYLVDKDPFDHLHLAQPTASRADQFTSGRLAMTVGVDCLPS